MIMTRLALACALACTLPFAAPRAQEAPVQVFAAASLKTALDEIASDWRQQTGHEVTISYAGSSALARQIEEGAPADIFISASTDWMDALDKGGHVDRSTREDLLANTLVLVAPKGTPPLSIADLPAKLGNDRLAMALVDSVPAGVYGKQALTSLGLWDEIAPKVAQADNVRAALALVSRAEAPFGVVYSTDAAADPGVAIVATFPADSHDPITYPAAVTSESKNPLARTFLDHLSGPEARKVLEGQGFVILK